MHGVAYPQNFYLKITFIGKFTEQTMNILALKFLRLWHGRLDRLKQKCDQQLSNQYIKASLS